MRRVVGSLLLALAVAGCTAKPSTADDPTESLPVDAPVIDVPPIVEEVRSLAEPPHWRAGEWWRIRLTDLFTGEDGATYESLRVVGGIEGDNYLVGMPADTFSHDLLLLHIPGFGEVDRADLSYETHDVRFHPLLFPLVQGATWQTAWEGRPLTATVTSADDKQAHVYLAGTNDHVNLTYDAEAGEVVDLQIDGYARYEAFEHGFDYEGRITVPHGHDLVFVQVRANGVLGPGNTPAPSPADTVTVEDGYDRVSFILLVGNFLAGPPQGMYKEKATAPDGTVFELESNPTDTPGLIAATYTHDDPGGQWTFEHLAAGPGIALAEGIAYHVYDVELPSGRILPSMGQHDHGS